MVIIKVDYYIENDGVVVVMAVIIDLCRYSIFFTQDEKWSVQRK